ncbi:MAG: hypothetical protein AAF191_00710 [Verrucomicrobiota bacterium]
MNTAIRKGLLPLTEERCVIKVTGKDRLRYLNGQLTNDVRQASVDHAIYTCITDAKGKLQADAFLSEGQDGDSLWLDAPMDLRDVLLARLERYIIADDVTLQDETGNWELWHTLEEEDAFPPDSWTRKANRFGHHGRDLLFPQGSLSLQSRGDREGWEALRISLGMAQWGAELRADLLPPEAKVEPRAIDYNKGCYIGQEVLSRIKSAKKVNRELQLLAAPSDSSLPIASLPTPLWINEKEVGSLTSVMPISMRSHFDRIFALGFVKRGHASPGVSLTCRTDEDGPSCQWEVLPFPLFPDPSA